MIQRRVVAWVVATAAILVLLVAFGTVALDVSASGPPTAPNTYDDGVMSHGAYAAVRMNDTGASGCSATAGGYQSYIGAVPNIVGGGDQTPDLTSGPDTAVFTDQGSCHAQSQHAKTIELPTNTGAVGGVGVWFKSDGLGHGTNFGGESTWNIMTNEGSSTEGWAVQINSSGALFNVAHSGNWTHNGGPWALGSTWHYLVVTQDAATYGLSFFIDGALVDTASFGSALHNLTDFGWDQNCWYYLCGQAASGWYSEAWWTRGAYNSGGSQTVAQAVAQDYNTMTTGAGPPPPDLLGNGGNPVTQRPAGIAPIVAQTCTTPTDWTQIQQYISWLACQIQNIMAAVLNPVITVLNWGMNLVAWFFDFSKPVVTTPLLQAGSVAKTRFPFSIPFDIGGILSTVFGATPTAPVFDLVIHENLLGADFHVVFNLSWMSPIMPLIRWGELAIFTVGLGLAYRKWSGGGW